MNKKRRCLRQVIALLLVLCMAAMYPATALAAETAPVEKAAEEVTSEETTAAVEETTAATAAIEEAAATTAPTEATAPLEITVIASGEGDTYAWTLTSDGTLTISGTRMPNFDYRSGDPTVPWVAYRNEIITVVIATGVENIGDYAFEDCVNLTTVTVSESVTSIGDNAFVYCDSLAAINVAKENANYCSADGILYDKPITKILYVPRRISGSITIPEGVTAIDDYAFQSRIALKAVTIPNGVTSIGAYAFNRCCSLISVTIPEGVTSIGYDAFADCEKLAEVTVPASMTSIGNDAFIRCGSLTAITVAEGNANYCSFDGILYDKPVTQIIVVPQSIAGAVTIPEGVTSIDVSAFFGCSGLTSVTIPKGVTSIGESAFEDCGSLTGVTIPEGVISIGKYAFEDCSSLSSITIPDSVTSVGMRAFCRCGSLTSVTIPEGVTSIGEDAFDGCGSLTAITVAEENANYCSFDGILYDKPVTKIVAVPDGIIGSVTIPEGVISIGKYAFDDCSSLSSISIPASVTSIGEDAFYRCGSLTAITVAEGNANYCSADGILYDKPVTQIIAVPQSIAGAVTIPEGVTSIGKSAFEDCGSLTGVTIPKSVTSIGYSAFSNCSSLSSITIPDSVTSIGNWAFAYCKGLVEVTIPDSVTSIGENAFNDGCTSLPAITVADGNANYCSIDGIVYDKPVTKIVAVPDGIIGSVTIPEGVTSIGDLAFSGCNRLEGVTIPKSVTSIGYSAFVYCSSLTRVTISEGVVSIGESAFDYCSSLTRITIPESVTDIAIPAFLACDNLTAITVAEGNANYCSVDGILYDKPVTKIVAVPDGLTGKVKIPEGVTYVGYDWPNGVDFSYCRSLTGVTIPKSATYIGEACFRSCSSLNSIIFLGDRPQIWQRACLGVTANAYYPYGNTTWTAENMRDYGGTLTWIPYYPILEGNGSVVTENDGQSITVRADAPFDQFQSVDVDGVAVAQEHYDASEGSTIVTLHGDYLATLEAGEHTMTMHFADGAVAMADFTLEPDPVECTHEDIKDSGKCSICGEIIDGIAALNARSLTLEGEIGVNFYMNLTEKTLADRNVKVVFTVAGKTTEVPVTDGVQTENGYRFTCKVAAKQMSDEITARVVLGDGTQGKAFRYSVRQYFQNRLASPDVSAEMQALAAAMLNYGAAAQNYFGYRTEDLANAGMGFAPVTVLDAGALESYKGTVNYTDKNTAGITVRYGTLVLESTTIVRAYFQLKEGEEIGNYRFTVNGKEVTPTKSGEQYVVDSEGIVAKRLNENCTIVVEKDGAVVLTMHYGAWSYAYSKLSSATASETLKMLVSALYAYHQAASAYFA